MLLLLCLPLVAVAYFATAGLAQANGTIADELSQLPACGLACLTSAVAAAGCSGDDYACICGSGKDAVKEHAIPCITSTCSTADALKIQPIALQICQIVDGLQNSSSVASSSATTAQASLTSSALLTTSTSTPESSSTIASSTTTGESRTSSSSSKVSSTTSPSTTLASPTSAAPQSSSSAAVSHPASKGLSKGAIVGISIGAAVGGLLLLAVIGILAFGYRKRGRDLKHLAALSAVDEKLVGRHELGDTNHAPKGDIQAQNDGT